MKKISVCPFVTGTACDEPSEMNNGVTVTRLKTKIREVTTHGSIEMCILLLLLLLIFFCHRLTGSVLVLMLYVGYLLFQCSDFSVCCSEPVLM